MPNPPQLFTWLFYILAFVVVVVLIAWALRYLGIAL
jgi:hypothetical protein